MDNTMDNTKQAKLIDLHLELTSDLSPIGDWKIIKCYEAMLLNKDMPYDVEELIAQRQAVRDEINKMENE